MSLSENEDSDVDSLPSYASSSDEGDNNDLSKDSESDEDFPAETQSLVEKDRKRKIQQKSDKQKLKKKMKNKKSIVKYGWDADPKSDAKNINYKGWQMSNSQWEAYFFGPDDYIDPNPSTMKKFIDALKKEQIAESTVNIMIGPMKK